MVFLRFLLILIILTTTSLVFAQDVQVIGHRGAMGHAPENTISSVKKALMYDIDAIEIDVFTEIFWALKRLKSVQVKPHLKDGSKIIKG